MRNKRWYAGIVFVFAIFMLLRIMFSTSVPYFSSDDSYAQMRIAEQFSQDFLYKEDNLSFLGREAVYHPVQAFTLSLLYYTPQPFFVYKVILNTIIAFACLILSFRLIEMAKHKVFGFLLGILIFCIPLLYADILNTVSIDAFFLFLAVLSLVSFTKREFITWRITLYVSTILGILLTPFFILIIASYIFYTFWKKIVKSPLERVESEFILFSAILTTVWNYILYIQILEFHGFNIFFYPSGQTIYELIPYLPFLGLLPFILSLFVVLDAFKTKNDIGFLSAGISAASLVALLFTLGSSTILLLLINIASFLALLFLCESWYEYLLNTKLTKHAYSIMVSMLLVLFLLQSFFAYSFVQATLQTSTNQQFVETLLFIKSQDPHPILVPIEFAQATMYFAQQPTYADTNTLLLQNAKYKQELLTEFFSTPYASQKIEAQTQLGARKNAQAYVLDMTQSQAFVRSDCFAPLYHSNEARVFLTQCEAITQ